MVCLALALSCASGEGDGGGGGGMANDTAGSEGESVAAGSTASGGSGEGGASGAPASGGSSSTAGSGQGGTSSAGSSATLDCDAPALMQASCTDMGCHTGPNPAASLDLMSADVEQRLVDVPSQSCPGWTLVVAGSVEQSLLYQKTALDMPQCGLRMPVLTALPEGDVECIRQWIVGLAGDSPPPPCENCGTTVCIDLQNDPQFCGDCDTNCGDQICNNGQCQGCAGNQTACNGKCVDTTNDSQHCGGCGNVCGGGETCVDSQCECAGNAAVSFADDILPILTGGCAGNGCHAGRRPQEQLGLEGDVAYEELVGPNSVQCTPSRPLVAPGDSSGSYLMDKLLGRNLCMGTAMPKGAQPLSQQQLDRIGAWICAGAPDN